MTQVATTPSEQTPSLQEKNPIRFLFSQQNVKDKFKEVMGNEAPGFIASVLQVISNDKYLSKADPISILNSAAIAASLKLPINNNLGFAWIVPYKGQGQFQIGWKGFVQLALRTNQYHKINVVSVYKNQFKFFNALTEELDAEFTKDGEGDIVGYCAYFRTTSGFEKILYWSRAQVEAHAKKYSKAYVAAGDYGSPWKDKDQFHEMAKKTVLKNILSKWGIMSIELNKAIKVDQGVIKDEQGEVVEYVDNTPLKAEPNDVDKERERLHQLISTCTKKDELEALSTHLPPDDKELSELYDAKLKELTPKK